MYVDVRAALLDARSRTPDDLYYRTDTHWTNHGAEVAFNEFARRIESLSPDLNWPEGSEPLIRLERRGGGDLARMLRIDNTLDDLEPITRAMVNAPQVEQYQFDKGGLVSRSFRSELGGPGRPQLIVAPRALNDRRVLWLHDSFGTALFPSMTSTFSRIVHVHWLNTLSSPQRFAELVEDFRPEFVFVTVVERDAFSRAFSRRPPGVPSSP